MRQVEEIVKRGEREELCDELRADDSHEAVVIRNNLSARISSCAGLT
jgi:hypothetical protein